MTSVILGLDLSTRCTGWGMVAWKDSLPPAYVASGVAEWKPKTPLGDVLRDLSRFLVDAQAKGLTAVVAEDIFVGPNRQTVLSLAEMRGVVRHVCCAFDTPLLLVAPSTVKKQLAGHGRASKGQVAQAVGLRLGIDVSEMPPDQTDALAVALCAEIKVPAKATPVEVA